MSLSGMRFFSRCGELLGCLTTRKRATREDLKHESSPPPQSCPPSPHALPDYSKLPTLPSDIWTNIFQHLRHRAADVDDPRNTDIPPGQVDLSRMMRVNKAFHDLAAPVLYRSIVTQSLPKLLVALVVIDDRSYFAQLGSRLVRIQEIEQETGRRFTVGSAAQEGVSRSSSEAIAPRDASDELVGLDIGSLQVLQNDLVGATGNLHKTCKVAKCAPTIHRYLVLTHKLHLVCPGNIARSPESNASSSDDDLMGPLYREQLRYYFGLWEALRFLAESPEPLFPNLKHLTLGNPHRNSDLKEEFLVSTWQNEALRAVYSDANEELSSFVTRTKLRSVCLYSPRDFVQLGRADQCLIFSESAVNDRDNSEPPLLTLHSREVLFMGLAGRCFAAGCRIRFAFEPEPDSRKTSRQAHAQGPPGTASDLEEQLREIRLMLAAAKSLPEWEYTDMELVILPVDTALYAQVHRSKSNTRPVLTAHEWNRWMLDVARDSLNRSIGQMGVTSGQKTIRVITSVSESPWGDCFCTDESAE